VDDSQEPEYWDDNEIEIEDLGAPDKGLDLFIFSLGKKMRATPRFRAMPVALALTMSLLAILVMPGSSLMRPAVPAAQSGSATSRQLKECSVVVIPTIDIAHLSTPISSSTVTVYSCGSMQIFPEPPITPASPSQGNTPQP